MLLNFEEKLSDSPYIERVWRARSERSGTFISMALSHWQMCIWQHNGKFNLTVRGPETKATQAIVPENAEHFGIVFKLGTFMPRLPAAQLVDSAIDLPDAVHQSFWLDGSPHETPTYENADTFVDRLVHDGLLVREPVVNAALQGDMNELSLRSVQRRFVSATGVTHRAVYQIERARYATILLKRGMSILDTVEAAGYADQPHLTRSLKHLVGQTPAQIIDTTKAQQLSYLFDSGMVTGSTT